MSMQLLKENLSTGFFRYNYCAILENFDKHCAMSIEELKEAVKAKSEELELALALKMPYTELRAIYQELKELRFQMVQIEYNLQQAE